MSKAEYYFVASAVSDLFETRANAALTVFTELVPEGRIKFDGEGLKEALTCYPKMELIINGHTKKVQAKVTPDAFNLMSQVPAAIKQSEEARRKFENPDLWAVVLAKGAGGIVVIGKEDGGETLQLCKSLKADHISLDEFGQLLKAGS